MEEFVLFALPFALCAAPGSMLVPSIFFMVGSERQMEQKTNVVNFLLRECFNLWVSSFSDVARNK